MFCPTNSSSIFRAQARKLEMDEELVGQYIAGLKQVQKKYRLAGEFGVSMLTHVNDLFHVREVEANRGGEREALLKALATALKKLERSREREGAQLKADMDGQIEHIGQIALALEERAAENGARSKTAAESQNGGREGSDTTTVSKGNINDAIPRR